MLLGMGRYSPRCMLYTTTNQTNQTCRFVTTYSTSQSTLHPIRSRPLWDLGQMGRYCYDPYRTLLRIPVPVHRIPPRRFVVSSSRSAFCRATSISHHWHSFPPMNHVAHPDNLRHEPSCNPSLTLSRHTMPHASSLVRQRLITFLSWSRPSFDYSSPRVSSIPPVGLCVVVAPVWIRMYW
jgi:hypothetical protein